VKLKVRYLTGIIAIILILILIIYQYSTYESKDIEIHNTLVDKETHLDVLGNEINTTYYHIDLTLTNLEDVDISTAYIHFRLVLQNNSIIEPNCFPFNLYSPEILSKDESKRFEIVFFIYNESNLPKELRYSYNGINYSADLENYESEKIDFQFLSIIGIIGLIILITIIIWFFDLKRTKKKEEILKCLICFDEIPKGKEIYCSSWKSETRICNKGPFCSKRCLKKHIEKIDHEHVVGI
jgi:hypothetical protein